MRKTKEAKKDVNLFFFAFFVVLGSFNVDTTTTKPIDQIQAGWYSTIVSSPHLLFFLVHLLSLLSSLSLLLLLLALP